MREVEQSMPYDMNGETVEQPPYELLGDMGEEVVVFEASSEPPMTWVKDWDSLAQSLNNR